MKIHGFPAPFLMTKSKLLDQWAQRRFVADRPRKAPQSRACLASFFPAQGAAWAPMSAASGAKMKRVLQGGAKSGENP